MLMKTRHIILAGILILSICLTSCGRPLAAKAANLSEKYERTATDPGAVTSDFTKAFSDFSFRLFSESVGASEDNKLISPLSAMLCLSLIANGAEGETLAEMESVLGLPVGELNKALYAYTEGLVNEKDSKMELANSVWFRNTDALEVKESFLQTLADWYQAEAYGAPFDESTRKDLDEWVSEHTDGMIQKMLDEPIDPTVMMYLVNALVFDAKWAKAYEKGDVDTWLFTSQNGRKNEVQGLFSDESVYLSAEGVKGVAKLYKNAGYFFVGLLPEDEKKNLGTFISELNGSMWQELWMSRTSERVETMIPEFKIEDKTELTDILNDLGMKKMFSLDAEFLPMASYNKESLYCSAVVQKVYLELDRHGTKAAAVTWGEMDTKSAMPVEPKKVYLDHPFVYMIVDAKYGLPLFVGSVEEL